MSMLSIVKSAEARTWVLQEDRQAIASLHLSRTYTTSGDLRTIDGGRPIARAPRHWWQITLGGDALPQLSLGRDTATVPGIDEPMPWEVRGRFSRFHTVLGSYQRTIVLDASGWRNPGAEVHISGRWERRDEVVLACFFAVLVRRRRSIILLSS